ncbi:MAG: inverse autotransporter beta domain-containing protein [Parachlamydiales bacterium]|jgi:hypothetical protein
MKKCIFFSILFGCFFNLQAADQQPVEKSSFEVASSPKRLLTKIHEYQAPDWLKRVDFMWNIQRSLHPTWSLETIQPLYRTKDSYRNTIFFQGRARYKTRNTTFNLGLGYRYLSADESCMIGVNSFYDFTTRYKHQRWGAGAEVFSNYTVLRANCYKGLTSTKTIKKINDEITTERVLGGWNIECEIPFPFLPWIRFTVDYYFWDGHNVKDEKGYHVSCLMDICDYLTLESGIDQSNYHKNNNFILLSFHLGRPERIQYTLFNKPYTKQAFSKRSVKMRTLEKVRRENNVVVLRKRKGSGLVTISRGS